MIRYGSAAAFAIALGCWCQGGAAQYESCITNGTVADIGNGRCDSALNVPSCGFDGGDCCPCTCSDGPSYSCSDSDFDCVYPECGDSTAVTSEEATCLEIIRIGDGFCDVLTNNNVECSWDGGDCCEESCVDGALGECGVNGYSCLDPAFYDPELVAKYPDCTGSWWAIGDGSCDASNNNVACGYDGGDCCMCSCTDDAVCHLAYFDCLDPTAGDELYECNERPPAALPCSAEVQQTWTVESSEQAKTLAASINCSGGSFEVEWRGRVVVDETIYVADGTLLTISGADGAGIDGNATTRLFTVVNASLHLSDVNLTSGASVAGGAIAAAGSDLTFNRTNFVGNRAVTGHGGAVIVSGASTVSCAGGGTFADNSAEMRGGAMYVGDGSTVWCGGSWVSNTADIGGALYVEDSSRVSWEDETVFAFNTASTGGGALFVTGASISWSGTTDFFSNTADGFGGALIIIRSTVSWSGTTTFANCAVLYYGSGGAIAAEGSAVSWSGRTEFVANYAGAGGAIYMFNGSSISWSGTTEFTLNVADQGGGAVGSLALDSASGNLETSTLSVNGTTTFSSNSCGISGGAIAFLGAGLAVEIGAADVSFINNTANVAGGAIYISGTGVGQIFSGVRFVSNSAQVGGAVSSVASGNLAAEFATLVPTTFERCHFVDNRAAATGGAVESAGGQDSFADSVFRGNKAGTGGALRLAGVVYMDNCSFVENLSDHGEGAALSIIGSILEMTNISFSGNAFDCEPGMFLGYSETGDPYEFACNGCDVACDGCSFEEPSLVPTCAAELDHTYSAGGTVTLEQLTVEAGYWRATESSTDILECFHSDACLGGVTGTADYCREGYEGPYCSVCSDGYTTELGFVCRDCSDSAGGIALAVVSVLLAVVALVAAAAAVSYGRGIGMRQGTAARLGRYIPLQSVKIAVVTWQILTQFSTVANVTYPEVYERFLDGLKVFNFDLSWVLSAGCIFDVDFHGRLLMATIGPIVAMLFLAVAYLAAARIHRSAPETLQNVWSRHVSMVLLLTFFVYSSVSSVLFMAFACEDLDDGKNYLRADYRIECDSPRHRGFQVYAVFMIGVYTVGIPVLYGMFLFRDREILRRDMAQREESSHVSSTVNLWKPYKPSAFYYEVIECARRVSLAGMVVFTYPNTAAQIAISLLMAILFAIASEGLDPYASRWDTWLNRIGHATVYLSMYVALLLKVDVSNERATGQTVFEAFLIAAHACLILVVVVETILLACANYHQGRDKARERQVAAAEDDPFSNDIYEVAHASSMCPEREPGSRDGRPVEKPYYENPLSTAPSAI